MHISSAALFVVATPIGNLGDMTTRAVDVLRSVDLIAAEDTRHSSRLLDHFSIDTPLMSYHDYSSEAAIAKLEVCLSQGQSLALISDAGTPLIADPGYRIVSHARALGFPVVPIPGACALTCALSASGLPSDRFSFEGFLPAKAGPRQVKLEALGRDTRTLIFYEAPHRVLACLQSMLESFGDRQVVVARELTKTFETFLPGQLSEVIATVAADANQQRGEIVIMVRGHQEPKERLLDDEAIKVMTVLLKTLPVKQAAAIGAELTGLKKRDLYQWAISLR